MFRVEHDRKLAKRHAMLHRNRKVTRERAEITVKYGTAHSRRSDRIRSIKNDNLEASACGLLDHVCHRCRVGVEPSSDVLKINYQCVQCSEHCIKRPADSAVETVDR